MISKSKCIKKNIIFNFCTCIFFWQAFGLGLDGDMSYIWKCLVIISGVYLFFFLEYVMKMIVRFKQKSSCDNDEGLVS